MDVNKVFASKRIVHLDFFVQMAFNKKIHLFSLTVLSLVVHIQTGYGFSPYIAEGVFFNPGTIKCDQIVCPLETDRCYVLKIYDEQNAIVERENICYSQDDKVLDQKIVPSKDGYYEYNAINEIILERNGTLDYFKLDLGESRPLKEISDIKKEVETKKEEIRIKMAELRMEMDKASHEMEILGQKLGMIAEYTNIGWPEKRMLMQKVKEEMRNKGEDMKMIGEKMRMVTKDINWYTTNTNICGTRN